MTGWSQLENFLNTDTDTVDVGCDKALELLHVFVERVEDESEDVAARHYPGVWAHLLACGPCAEDYRGLLVAAGSEYRER